jgi:hypothetical protein
MTPDELDQRAKELFQKNAKGWNGTPPWEELHDDTRKLWREEVLKRTTDIEKKP